MFGRFSRAPVQSDAASLERYAERAGSAWACTYSTSAEFDAALIAERRAAGVYGPRRHRRQLFMAVAGIGAGLGVIGLVIAALA